MNERTIKELNQEQPTEFCQRMLTKVKGLVNMSRGHMSEFHNQWKLADLKYNNEKDADRADATAQSMNEPGKYVVPMTSAQVNTFVAFCLMQLHQNPRLWQLDPQGAEDFELSEVNERLLQRDWEWNRGFLLELAFLQDVAKYSIGVLKHYWHEEERAIPVTTETAGRSVFGWEIAKGKITTTWQKVKTYEGNKVICVSPWRFFPDTRLPLTRLHEGEFCGSEDEFSRSYLKELESSKVVSGIKYVRETTKMDSARLKGGNFTFINDRDAAKANGYYCVTEVQVKIIPSEFELEDGKPLGEEDFPITYLVWYANDDRIIRLEPMNYLHGQFTYDVATFGVDQQKLLSKGIPELLGPMQEVVDWLMNARLLSVKRTLDNQLVVDPNAVEMSSVLNRSRVILLKKGAGRLGVQKSVMQLGVQDVTQAHINDANMLLGISQTALGINDNAMGQFHSGRRSASEARVVAQGSAGRMMVLCQLIWKMALAPLGAKMLMNLRQGLSENTFMLFAGMEKMQAYPQFKSTPQKLAMALDYFMFDSTTPSEKIYLAQTLQEVFGMVFANPQAALQLNISPKLVFDEMMKLRSVGNITRFDMRKDPMAMQQLQMMNANGANPITNPGGVEATQGTPPIPAI